MNKSLNKEDVLKIHKIWKDWIDDKNPDKKIPHELTDIQNNSGGVMFFWGLFLHILLSILCKFFLLLRLNSISVILAKARIKYDHLYYEPKSCGMSNTFIDMGIAYFQKGDFENAEMCLARSWKVYPCPHNTTFGFRTKLYQLLKTKKPNSTELQEFIEIRNLYRT